MAAEKAVAMGIHYIGRGYNLVYGNPDYVGLNEESRYDAVDPGMNVNQILDLTWASGNRDRSGR